MLTGCLFLKLFCVKALHKAGLLESKYTVHTNFALTAGCLFAVSDSFVFTDSVICWMFLLWIHV